MMEHVDEELLTLLALQVETPDPATAEHLRTCAHCQTELAVLRRVVSAGQSAPREHELVEPPSRVWDHITDTRSAVEPSPAARDRETSEPPAPRTTPSRRRTPSWLAVAAGFLVGAVAAGTLVAVLDDDEGSEPAGSVVASAQLDPLDATGTAGSADVVDVDGQRVLAVQLADRTPGGGFREVWLLDADAQRLVSLGVLTGVEGRFVIPDGLDLADYPVVDVSREPFDGDPAHSTDSIARGRLPI
jgi:hypothetical protein